jgi:uncharacterized protein (DUF2141 family)
LQAKAIIALAFAVLAGFPAPSQSCSLTLHVDGFRDHKGVIGCAVFKDSKGWPEHDEEAFTRAAIPITSGTAVLRFDQVPLGRYGIACLHDENANHHLDRNFFRIPKEGFGFANNPRVVFAPPSWQDASVEIACPSTRVDIHLIYK